MWEMYLDQVVHELRPVLFRAAFGHRDHAPIVQRGKGQEQVPRPVAFILRVVARRLTGGHRHGGAGLRQELFVAFIHAD